MYLFFQAYHLISIFFFCFFFFCYTQLKEFRVLSLDWIEIASLCNKSFFKNHCIILMLVLINPFFWSNPFFSKFEGALMFYLISFDSITIDLIHWVKEVKKTITFQRWKFVSKSFRMLPIATTAGIQITHNIPKS